MSHFHFLLLLFDSEENLVLPTIFLKSVILKNQGFLGVHIYLFYLTWKTPLQIQKDTHTEYEWAKSNKKTNSSNFYTKPPSPIYLYDLVDKTANSSIKY